MKQLFTNNIKINASKSDIAAFLTNAEKIYSWNPAIAQITKLGNGSFSIHRTVPAINQDETISIEKVNDQIIYASTGGKMKYELVFEMNSEASGTNLKETFNLTNELNLPTFLLSSMAKPAFNQNLNTLKQLMEHISAQ